MSTGRGKGVRVCILVQCKQELNVYDSRLGQKIQPNVSLLKEKYAAHFFFDYLHDKQTDGRTDGQTDPLTELQGCI